MGKIINFKGKCVNEEYIRQLELQLSEIVANAEITETGDRNLVMDAISEMKCNDIEVK